METIQIAAPPAELEARAVSAAALAKSYVGKVDSPEMREALGLDLQANKGLQKLVEGERVKITKPINEGLRAVNALFKRMSDPLELGERQMKTEGLRWDQEQARIQREAEQRNAAAADAERARLNELAEQATAAGNVETAHAVRSAAAMVAPVPIIAQAIVKIAGEATRELWRAEVDDIKELCRAIGAGEVSTENVLPNMPTLNSQARALKGSMRIPGVRAVGEQVLATRAA